MKHIINKGLLICLTSLYVITAGFNANAGLISAALLSIAAVMLCPAVSGVDFASAMAHENSYEKSSSHLHLVCELLVCAYIASGFIIDYIYLFLPLIIYDVCRYRLKVSAATACILAVFMFRRFSAELYVTELCLAAVSASLSFYCCRLDLLKHTITAMKDDTTEHDLLVEQSTRQLLENQDNMILTATLSERNRIAREIHDNVGHMLTRSILQTGAIKVINHDERLNKPLEQLQSTLDTAMDSMRKSVHDLHDESVNLKLALDDLIRNVQGINIQLDYDMSDKLPKEIKYSFINIIKEAISNTMRHSNGDQINIRLREHPAFYQLYIKDNGSNAFSHFFDPDSSSCGMGLYGIRERVNKLGGTMKISTQNGFSIAITIIKQEKNQ